jgi:hypothetical protein
LKKSSDGYVYQNFVTYLLEGEYQKGLSSTEGKAIAATTLSFYYRKDRYYQFLREMRSIDSVFSVADESKFLLKNG